MLFNIYYIVLKKGIKLVIVWNKDNKISGKALILFIYLNNISLLLTIGQNLSKEASIYQGTKPIKLSTISGLTFYQRSIDKNKSNN